MNRPGWGVVRTPDGRVYQVHRDRHGRVDQVIGEASGWAPTSSR